MRRGRIRAAAMPAGRRAAYFAHTHPKAPTTMASAGFTEFDATLRDGRTVHIRAMRRPTRPNCCRPSSG